MTAELPQYKRDFIEFMVRAGVLAFGDFTTKSGRKSPYFVNTGGYRTGAQLARLAGHYADAVVERLGSGFDVLFGPAYKGIPLAVATAMALAQRTGRDVAFCFNRKEAKDHGEGGSLIGHVPRDGERILIVEDVTTAGTSVRESVALLERAARVRCVGLVVSVDRMERGTGDRSALVELSDQFRFPCFAIVTIDDIMTHLNGRAVDGRVILTDDIHARMLAYRREYGPRS